MRVSWSTQAAEALRDTTSYVRREFGIIAKQKLLTEVREVIGLLPSNPYIGKIEHLLQNASVVYRSFVINKLNKIVYYVNEETDTIEIAALWDTRREPNSQADLLKS